MIQPICLKNSALVLLPYFSRYPHPPSASATPSLAHQQQQQTTPASAAGWVSSKDPLPFRSLSPLKYRLQRHLIIWAVITWAVKLIKKISIFSKIIFSQKLKKIHQPSIFSKNDTYDKSVWFFENFHKFRFFVFHKPRFFVKISQASDSQKFPRKFSQNSIFRYIFFYSQASIFKIHRPRILQNFTSRLHVFFKEFWEN